jgi:hypothetical protein
MAFKMKAGAEGPMKKNFPDLNKDGKITQADILMGRGVFKKTKADVINQYASGIGDAMAGLAKDMPSKEERKEKKRQRMEDKVARDFKKKK